MLAPPEGACWLGEAVAALLFGMAPEWLPAAAPLIPVMFPIATRIGIHPAHFHIGQAAAMDSGLFTPRLGAGLLMALRFADLSAAINQGPSAALFVGLIPPARCYDLSPP